MAIRIAPTSGSTTSPSPVCTIRSMPATGSAPSSSLSSSAATRSAVMRPSCGAISISAVAHPRRDGESELRDEPRRAQHPQRIVAERHLGRRRACPARRRAAPPNRLADRGIRPSPSGGDAHRHRVDGEVAAHQIVVEVVAEAHLRVARHLVIGVGAERGDLERGRRALPTPMVPNSMPVSHSASAHGRSNLLHPLGPGVGGEVQVASASRPSSASRTLPPTRYSSWPASANNRAEVAQHVGMLVAAPPAAAASSSASAAESGTSDEPSGHTA